MPACTESARLTQACQLVRGLRGALVIEVPHEACRVDRARPPARELRKRLADVRHAAQIFGQQRPRRAALGYRADVKMPAPVALRQVGRLVPVVGRPVEPELRTAARLEVHKRVRRLSQGSPHLEGRIDLERIGPVVLEDRQCRPGVHEQCAVAAGLERTCGPAADRLQVRSKAGFKLGREVGPRTNVRHRCHPWKLATSRRKAWIRKRLLVKLPSGQAAPSQLSCRRDKRGAKAVSNRAGTL